MGDVTRYLCVPLTVSIFFAGGCSSATSLLSSLSSSIQVIMAGSYETPDGAAGNADPKFVAFTLNSVVLKSADGDLAVFDGEPTEFRIISRDSLIAEKDLTDQEGLAYTGAEVTFAADVTMGGKYADDLTATLAAPTATLTESLAIETAKTIKLFVKAKWRNTVTRDDDAETETAVAPSLSVSRSN